MDSKISDFGYTGTAEELNAIQGEIRDVCTRRSEMTREIKLLWEHYRHVQQLMFRNLPDDAA